MSFGGRTRAWCLVAAVVTSAISGGDARAQASPWMDSTLPASQRARLFVAAMTQDEKLSMVHGVASVYEGHVAGIARLGMPDLNLEDGPAGVSDGMTQATVFPAPITIASSWDVGLARQFGATIAHEEKGKGATVVLAPMMNIDRAPEAGRNFEGFGEDPALTGAMAAAVIDGIQSQGLVATAKHYLDNDQETDRMGVSAVVDPRTQHEIYLPPFGASVAAGVGAVMCSYNRIGGTYACEDDATQNGWLKGDLGFAGWIMSDWGATHSVASALHGLDMQMPDDSYLGASLASAVDAGVVPQSRLDDMVTRILVAMFGAGLFDRAASGSPSADVRSAADTAFARTAAAQGTVLLRNDGGILPLDLTAIHSIAVIGAAGDEAPVIQGFGSSMVTPSAPVSPLQGIVARAGAGVDVGYAAGDTAPFADATRLAATSDVAIVVVGVSSSEGSDRASLALPSPADDLVAAVVQANPRTVVVVYAPAQVLMPWAREAPPAPAVPAIVFGGLPGEEEGNALADVLFGDVDPGGKLAITIAANADDYPASAASQFPGIGGVVTYSEGFRVGYRSFDANHVAPLFAFGHGLSFTTFAYSNLTIAPSAVAAGTPVSVEFDVTNVGRVAGSDVPQLYIGLPVETSEPPWQLRAFSKVSLEPGATQHESFTLSANDYSFWSAGLDRRATYAGTVAVRVGAPADDGGVAGTFSVTSDLGGRGTIVPATDAITCCGAQLAWDADGGAGTAFVAGLATPGASATFAVEAPGGACTLVVRYSAAPSPATLDVLVNGVLVGPVSLAPLANLSTWDFAAVSLQLPAGESAITFEQDPDAGAGGGVSLSSLIACAPSSLAPDAGLPGWPGGGRAPDAGRPDASGAGPTDAFDASTGRGGDPSQGPTPVSAGGGGAGCAVGNGPVAPGIAPLGLFLSVASLRRRRARRSALGRRGRRRARR